MTSNAKDTLARIAVLGLFLALFVGGPAVLALASGAAISGAASAGSLDFYTVSEDGDAGTSVNSIEFVDGDCNNFDAGVHPSGWKMVSGRLWGSFGGPYAAFYDAGGVFLGDCGVTRPGQYVVQAGRSTTTFATRAVALSSDFTMYAKYTEVAPIVATDGIGTYNMFAYGTGAPADYLACTYGTVSAGLNNNAGGVAQVGGVASSLTGGITLPLDMVRPRIMLMQKSGTTGRCWIGADDGTFVFTGSATVGASVGSVSQSIGAGNGVGAFGAGSPYTTIDYIRIVDGNGAYFP